MTNNTFHKFDIINICIGENIRKNRVKAGISAEEMAKSLKISVRLYRKYEKGTSEIPHSVLWDVANILALDIDKFFETLPKSQELDIFSKKNARKLLWCFNHISNPASSDNLAKLIKELSVMS